MSAMRGPRTKAWLILLAWGLPSRVLAGNDDGILLGNDAALVGGAVVSTVNDGSALWYNPAGLARADDDSVDVSASAFALRRYHMPGLLSADGGSHSDASFTEIVSIPSALTYVRRLSEHTVAGLALFASQVGDYTLRSSLTLPIQDVDLAIQLLLTQESVRYHLSGGFGTRLSRHFSLGMALFGDYQDQAGLLQSSSLARMNAAVLGSSVSSGYSQSKALGFHLRAGVVYEPSASFRVGLSVESPGVYFYRSERVTVVESTTALNDQGTFDLEAGNSDESTSDVELGLYAPLRVRLGGSFDVARATFAFEGDVQSKLKNDDVEVDRRLSFNLRAGARFAVGEHLRLGAGIFTDRGPERKDQWGAGTIDFYGATLGGQYENVRWLAGSGKNGQPHAALTFSSTVALRYAYGTGKLPGARLVQPTFETVTRGVDIDVHEVTLHLGSGIYF